MEGKENDNQSKQVSKEKSSPADRIETPPPAQEIYPVERAMNDENQKREEKKKKKK
jgi:hypothetical protein